jgi:two-component system NarL family sensor kinase
MWTLSKRSRLLAVAHSELKSEILERTVELQNLSNRLLNVQDEERRKLSRDLHDSTGQTLAALKISVSFLAKTCMQDAPTQTLVSEVAALADQAIDEIRTMTYLLHPPLLDEVGFACAAGWFVEGFAKRSGINVKADIAESRERLPKKVEITLFRILQEGLTNVHRHSQASDAYVCFERRPDMVTLEIRDFGKGIRADRLDRLRQTSAETGVGLSGMRERLRELNGQLEMDSNGQGTSVRATIPLYGITPGLQFGDYSEIADYSQACQ